MKKLNKILLSSFVILSVVIVKLQSSSQVLADPPDFEPYLVFCYNESGNIAAYASECYFGFGGCVANPCPAGTSPKKPEE